MMNDYHDYVIKDGRFIGLFEQMYSECDDPWNASKEDYDASACTVAAKQFIHSLGQARVVSLGSGTGRHLVWLACEADGVEVSATAVSQSQLRYPYAWVCHADILHFLATDAWGYDIFLFREVLWYVLQDWEKIVMVLRTHHGAYVMVELSFYDEQHYGREVFDGPDGLIRQFPFPIHKIVREHTSSTQREGRVLVIGRVP